MSDTNRGIYRKYDVRRTDGSSEPGGKHERCAYFVLDLEHDQFAIPALKAYAKACSEQYPELADDIGTIVESARSLEPDGPSETAQSLMAHEETDE